MRAMANTVSVTVTLTFDSLAAPAPPYNIASCSVYVQYADGTNAQLQGWGLEALGAPQANGAAFAVGLVDTNAAPATGVQNWALTCIPRAGTNAASPFGNNQNTLSGSGPGAVNGGIFSLNMNSPKIKNAGTWDWTLMVQVVGSDGVVRCFASDPEMEVGP